MYENQTKLVREARERMGLSQKDLASRLGYMTPQMISNWERGLCGVPLTAGRKVCEILKVKYAKFVDAVLEDTRLRYMEKAKAA